MFLAVGSRKRVLSDELTLASFIARQAEGNPNFIIRPKMSQLRYFLVTCNRLIIDPDKMKDISYISYTAMGVSLTHVKYHIAWPITKK